MADPRQQAGQAGETAAWRHLKKNGYKLLERNYRTSLGEIDIIARHKKVIVFIEVKARRTASFGHPKLAVTAQKQRKISMVALQYLKETGQSDAKARFDVVSILPSPEGPRIELIRNAFELAYP